MTLGTEKLTGYNATSSILTSRVVMWSHSPRLNLVLDELSVNDSTE